MIKIKEKIGPQNGAEHKLFGVKMLKRHQMREPEWTAPDKLKQYSGLVRLYSKLLSISPIFIWNIIGRTLQKLQKKIRLDMIRMYARD